MYSLLRTCLAPTINTDRMEDEEILVPSYGSEDLKVPLQTHG